MSDARENSTKRSSNRLVLLEEEHVDSSPPEDVWASAEPANATKGKGHHREKDRLP